MPALPSGAILLWSGSIATIPAGFVLCDGNNDTPDLRDRFLYGAGGALNPGATGGAQNHNHSFTSDGHSHTIQSGNDFATGAVFDNETSSDSDTGTTDNGSNMPPYYALAFMMKT